MTDVELIFLEAIRSDFQGETNIDELEGASQLVAELAWGVEAVDVVRSLSLRNLISFDSSTGVVTVDH